MRKGLAHMDSESVADLILRAVAAMREHGELPEFETPRITIARVNGSGAPAFRSNVGQALASAQTGAQPPQSARALAVAIAGYLREVVDLVPAYHDVALVTSSSDGSLTITLRGPETQ